MNIIFSDLHLGTPRCRIVELTKLIDSLDFNKIDKVILNGDILDIERMSKRWMFSASHFNLLERFIQLYNQEKLIYIRGNHEGELQHVGKMRLLKQYSYTSNGKYIMIYHGHLLNKIKLPKIIETYLDNLYNNNKDNVILNWLRNSVINYMNRLPELAREKNPNADFICIGHSHIPGISGNVYNSGDFVTNMTYLVEEEGVISLNYYDKEYGYSIS